MRSFQAVLIPAMLLLIAGCAPKQSFVLQGDNSYEMQSSIVMLSSELTPARKEEFEQAIATIVFSAHDRRSAENGERLTQESIKMLKGRTVTQVIESAKLIRTVAAYGG